MDGNSADALSVDRPAEDHPETTVEINVKTLDAQTYTLRVNKYVSVPDLKEQIASLTGILSGQQRLICQGKVLNDDQLLSAYHVEDGHTLHLVVRHPPSSSTSSARFDDAPSFSGYPPSLHPTQSSLGQNLLFGSVNLGDPGISGASELNQVLSALLGSLGVNNVAGVPEMPDYRVENNNLSERMSGSGVSESTQRETQQHTFLPPNVHYLGPHQHPMVIPDSITTLSQFLNHLGQQFAIRVHELSGRQNTAPALSLPPEQRGLPTPARLGEILLSSRQLLTDLVAQSLYDFAKLLEEQAVITDPLARARIQFEAGRFGNLIQNVGSLFLELGRTITTLDMGQTSSEAVVNAGPAIFVTSTAAAPVMVQAGISVGGAPTGAQNINPAPGLLSGNINIRIHRAGGSTGSQAGEQRQPSGVLAGSLAQSLMGLGGRLSETGGTMGLPLRTVIAIPAGITRPPPSDSSFSGSTQLLYPLFARVSQRGPIAVNAARVPQEPASRTSEPSASRDSTGLSGDTVVEAGWGDGRGESQQQAEGDGQFFSSLVRQLMPFISQNASVSEAGSSSSRRDAPPRSQEDEREPKRRKRE